MGRTMSDHNGTPDAPTPAPTPPAFDWRTYAIRWGGWAIAFVASVIASYLAGRPLPAPPEPPVWYGQGWVENPDEVARIVAAQPFPSFADTPAGKSGDELPKAVYLWDAYRKLHGGQLPPVKNQGQVGSCVSFGTATAVERTMAAEIAFARRPFEYKRLAEEVIYGGSRVEVGGGRLRGDGSVGAWAADFVRKWGVVARGRYGQHDLTEYSESLCRQYGSKGVPDDLEPTAREHPVQATTLVKTWVDAKKALANGYGIAICSNQGFSMTRDSRGIAKPQGSWAHCMALCGYHVEGNSEYGYIENSWGADAHKGPVGWGNPSTAGFWAESSVVERMLKQGDSWAFSSLKGFPARVKELDWYVYAPKNHNWYEPLYALAP